MIENASGIILRTRPLTETSLIVHWLTAEQGRVATVAKGARRAKSAFVGKLDLLFEADFSFQRSQRSDLHALREVAVRETHPRLRKELVALNQAAYAVAFIEQMTETDTPVPEIHELFTGFIRHLAADPPKPRNVFTFELKLLSVLGLEPDLEGGGASEAVRELINSLMQAEWTDLGALQTTGAAAREVRQFLQGFILQHCGKLPRGRSVALET